MSLREAAVAALGQPAASALAILMIAGMCATVLLTSGKAAGAQQDVVNSIDQAGTRSIVIHASASSGLDSGVIARIERVSGVKIVVAFGPAVDTTNTAIPGGPQVPVRTMWGGKGAGMRLPTTSAVAHSVLASPRGMAVAGLASPSGDLKTAGGLSYPVVGTLHVPEFLTSFEPLLVSPASNGTHGPVSDLIIIATDARELGAVTRATESLLDVQDPSTIHVTTSAALANLRAVVGNQLSGFGRALVAGTLGITALLVAGIMFGLVVLRRKDFGRRRALGARRSQIVLLITLQASLLACGGAIAGSLGALIFLAIGRSPLPDPLFFVAVGILGIAAGLLGSVPPAVFASRRDPVRELRVP